MWDRIIQAIGMQNLSLVLVFLVGLVLLAPFLLFLGRKTYNGRRILTIFVGLFTVIIGANVVMAVQAIRSFPGLEVANSYVASQQFDRDRTAQQRLGWVVTPDYDGEQLTLRVDDASGAPARIRRFSATIGRPTHVREDQTPRFAYEAGLYRAPLNLAPGMWNIHLVATAEDGTVFRQRIDHYHGNRVK